MGIDLLVIAVVANLSGSVGVIYIFGNVEAKTELSVRHSGLSAIENIVPGLESKGRSAIIGKSLYASVFIEYFGVDLAFKTAHELTLFTLQVSGDSYPLEGRQGVVFLRCRLVIDGVGHYPVTGIGES